MFQTILCNGYKNVKGLPECIHYRHENQINNMLKLKLKFIEQNLK